MGFDDFFVTEKKDEVQEFLLRQAKSLSDMKIEQIKECVERYAQTGWRMRVVYDLSTWLAGITYEHDKDATVINLGLDGVNYAPHRAIYMPGLVAFGGLMHDERFRANGNMPPQHCDFEIFHQRAVEQLERLYSVVQVRPGITPNMRIARVPFSIVQPDYKPRTEGFE